MLIFLEQPVASAPVNILCLKELPSALTTASASLPPVQHPVLKYPCDFFLNYPVRSCVLRSFPLRGKVYILEEAITPKRAKVILTLTFLYCLSLRLIHDILQEGRNINIQEDILTTNIKMADH